MAEKSGSSAIAIIALCVSIAGFGFTFYQWWKGEREAQIAAAIEVSRKLAEMPEDKNRKLLEAGLALFRDHTVTTEQATKLYQHMRDLDYVAYLTNRNRIDLDYLSEEMKCAMYAAHKTTEQFKTIAADPFTEIHILGPRFSALCEPHFQSFLELSRQR